MRAGPQDLPASRRFLIGCVASTLVVLFIGYRILIPGASPVPLAAIHTLLLGVSWIALLMLTGKMDRWHQSASAIYGCSAMINLVSLPIIANGIADVPVERTDQPTAMSVIMIGLWLWELTVTARIVRESIEIRMSSAFGISLLMAFAIQFTMVSLFNQSG